MISFALVRASLSSSLTLSCACARFFCALSAAARPSAILRWRSSIALVSGGQMNLTVNQMRIANEIIWPSKVIFGFMSCPANRTLPRPYAAAPATARTWTSALLRLDQAPAAFWTAPISGLANANIIATPTPIRNAASIRPASRNMRPCSIGTSSGWRAADSRNFEPMMPMPRAAPRAPRPTMIPMATAVKPWTLAMNSMVDLRLKSTRKVYGCSERDTAKGWSETLVMLVRHREVHDGQHHEDEGLQQDDQDVEDRPAGVEDHARHEGHPRGEQARDQHEHELARVHVAEQSHAQADGLGQVFDEVEEQVRDRQHDLGEGAVGVERSGEQLLGEAQ